MKHPAVLPLNAVCSSALLLSVVVNALPTWRTFYSFDGVSDRMMTSNPVGDFLKGVVRMSILALLLLLALVEFLFCL